MESVFQKSAIQDSQNCLKGTVTKTASLSDKPMLENSYVKMNYDCFGLIKPQTFSVHPWEKHKKQEKR